MIVLAQGNIDEAAMDLDGAVDVQKRGAEKVVAIKTNHFLSRLKRAAANGEAANAANNDGAADGGNPGDDDSNSNDSADDGN